MKRRSIQHCGDIQLRAGADDNRAPVIVGYGAVFYDAKNPGTEYRREFGDGWSIVERIMPGAFDAALARSDDVVALWGHDMTMPLGRRSRNTLRLTVDARGLAYEIDPPQTTWGTDAVASIGRGDVQGSSFGFAMSDGWREIIDRDKKLVIQEITSVARLYEVSPVAIPAYPGTGAEARAIADDDERLRAIVARASKDNFQTETAKAMVAVALASLD